MKDGWKDEQSEQTRAERQRRQQSNLVKSEWDVLFF